MTTEAYDVRSSLGIKLTTGVKKKNLWDIEIQNELQTTRNK